MSNKSIPGVGGAMARATRRGAQRASKALSGTLQVAREIKSALAYDAEAGRAELEPNRVVPPSEARFLEPSAAHAHHPKGEIPIHATVPDRERVPGVERHELSSLQGPRALAPDPEAIGEELVDPEAIEVPLGSSSDPTFAPQLSKSKLPQPGTTGSALLGVPEVTGSTQEVILDPSLADAADAQTVRPSDRPAFDDENYDAISPENAGLEWLMRATETQSAATLRQPDVFENLHVTDEEDMAAVAVSEGSLQASAGTDPGDREEHDGQTEEDIEEEEELLRESTWSRPDARVLVTAKSE